MNFKRTVTFGVLGAGCAAMLAGAMTTGRHEVVPPPSVVKSPVELQGAALGAEVARLRARLRPTVEPREPSRNLFQFGGAGTARPGGPSVSSRPVVAEPPLPQVEAPPPLKLMGLSEDPGADGPVRTAFISGMGEVVMAREGDVLAARYQVAQISGTGVVLTDLTNRTTIQLSLK